MRDGLLQIGKGWVILVGSVEKTHYPLYGKEHSCVTTLFQTALHSTYINVLNVKKIKTIKIIEDDWEELFGYQEVRKMS